MPRNLVRYYTNSAGQSVTIGRNDDPLEVVAKVFGTDDRARLGSRLLNSKVQIADPSEIRHQVAIERAAYNNVYYQKPPEYTQSAIQDRSEFTLQLGDFFNDQGPIGAKHRTYERDELINRTITSLMAQGMQKAMRDAINNEMYRDANLMEHIPRGIAAAPIEADVKYTAIGDFTHSLSVTVSGPFWLRFYFSGRRAFTITGNKANKASRGMLVFTDPHTGMKIVTPVVHMPAIPRGNYIEKGLRKALDIFVNTDRLEAALSRHVRKNYRAEGSEGTNYRSDRGMTYRDILSGGETELYRNWNKYLREFTDKVKGIRTPEGIAFFDILQAAGRGRRPNTVKYVEQMIQQDSQVRAKFLEAVAEYNSLPDEQQEIQRQKTLVYNALRIMVAEAKTELKLSDIKASLPDHLARRSTATSIHRKYRPQFVMAKMV